MHGGRELPFWAKLPVPKSARLAQLAWERSFCIDTISLRLSQTLMYLHS